MQPISEAHLIDCMEFMCTIPDKYFELAIVDPQYGIGEDGKKNHSRGKLAPRRSTRQKNGITNHLTNHILMNFLEFRRIKLYGVQTILLAECRMIVAAGLFGIKPMEKMILLIVNLLLHHFHQL